MNVTNVLAVTGTIPVNLDRVYADLRSKGLDVTRNAKFPGLFLKLKNGTCTIFKSGKVTINIRSLSDLDNVYTQLGYAFVKYRCRFSPPIIVNIAGSFKLGSRVKLAEKFSMYYNPDISNAANFKIGKCTILLHATGNGIITGAKSENDLNNTFNTLLNMIYWQ